MSAIEIIPIRSEQSLSKFFRDDLGNKDEFLYRGQSNSDWELIASFDRNTNGNLVSRQESFDVFFEGFRRRYMMRYSDELSKDQLVSLAQHYGLLTRLLDWTDKPYIALFFACTSPTAPRSSALYRLNRSLMTEKISDTDFSFVNAATSANIRLNNQFGFLLRNTSNFESFEKYLESRNDIGVPLLTKYILSRNTTNNVKKNLNQMGINYSSLFDGLEYLTKELNASLAME